MAFKKSLNEAEQEFNAIIAIDTEARNIAKDNNLAITDKNPYSGITVQVKNPFSQHYHYSCTKPVHV